MMCKRLHWKQGKKADKVSSNIYIIIFHQSVCASRVSEGAAENNKFWIKSGVGLPTIIYTKLEGL